MNKMTYSIHFSHGMASQLCMGYLLLLLNVALSCIIKWTLFYIVSRILNEMASLSQLDVNIEKGKNLLYTY